MSGKAEFRGSMIGVSGMAAPFIPNDREIGVLVVCTANVCRSPMAAALLARRLSGLPAAVRSAGLLRDGDPAAPEVVSVMAAYGLDATSHRSHAVSADDLSQADLVLGMAREHIRHAVVMVPGVWQRAFTLKELIRRGERIGTRSAGEPLTEWLLRAHAGRERAALLGDCAEDDVADPTGGPPQAYAAAAALLDRLVGRLVELCWGHAGAGSGGR
jgi:protein-tyrosine-phosphatase